MAKEVDTLRVQTETCDFELKGRPCELSAFSFVPTSRDDPPERTIFNSHKIVEPSSTYDRMFTKHDYGYNNKLHRCDREHAKSRGLQVQQEECVKKVPTLASSIYGHHLERSCDHPDRAHVRIAHVATEFYRRNGISSS